MTTTRSETFVEVLREDHAPALSVVRVVGDVGQRPELLAFVDIGETGTPVRVRRRLRNRGTGRPRALCEEHGQTMPACRHVADAVAAWDHVATEETKETRNG